MAKQKAKEEKAEKKQHQKIGKDEANLKKNKPGSKGYRKAEKALKKDSGK